MGFMSHWLASTTRVLPKAGIIMLEIAGNIMEGGGQILRNSSALSCILHKPIRIVSIRANRSKPGLRPQHLCGFKLIGEMCKAEMSGDVVDSCTVELSPSSTILGGIYTKEVGTAGMYKFSDSRV
ncbi:RTCA [Bugula neritina]|uniref:RNA 3'-terminal phosphate cyclase n=1 Tax=Bugula neritina TaxID=10212 RepID=A0A7J7KII7_BUGNE|nr:RTCA [Bugula neritina]